MPKPQNTVPGSDPPTPNSADNVLTDAADPLDALQPSAIPTDHDDTIAPVYIGPYRIETRSDVNGGAYFVGYAPDSATGLTILPSAAAFILRVLREAQRSNIDLGPFKALVVSAFNGNQQRRATAKLARGSDKRKSKLFAPVAAPTAPAPSPVVGPALVPMTVMLGGQRRVIMVTAESAAAAGSPV